MENVSVLLPDRSRASLASYLPIPYGNLKLMGLPGGIVLCIVLSLAAGVETPPDPVLAGLGLLLAVVALLITRLAARDVQQGDWVKAYLDRNWHGYTLWVYKVDDEVRYNILRDGYSVDYLRGEFREHGQVLISIPLKGWWPYVPTIIERGFSQRYPHAVGRTDHPSFTIRLTHRKFDIGWQVIVKDFYGDRLTVPIETALDIVSVDTPGWNLNKHYQTLNQELLGALEQHKLMESRGVFFTSRFMDARAVIEKAIKMIRDSTRFQRSKEGKEIREFLELRLHMLDTGDSEEEARKNMGDDVA